jgi:hypothetical protein
MTIFPKMLLAILMCATSLAGFSAYAQASAPQVNKGEKPRQIPVKKVFPYYDMYLSLPAKDRDGFALNYIMKTEQPNARPRMDYVQGATRTPIELNGRGQVLNLPDLNTFKSAVVEVPASAPKGSITLNLEPTIALAKTIPVQAVNNSVSDYAAAISRMGPAALVIPKLKGVTFKGVSTGRAVLADGRKIALQQEAKFLVFRPADPNFKTATHLEFDVVPTGAGFTK